MAAAAVELAEDYQRRRRAYVEFIRWGPMILVVGFTYLAVSAAFEGDQLRLILNALFVLAMIWNGIVFNPAIRPKNMLRSLEASRQIAASSVPPR